MMKISTLSGLTFAALVAAASIMAQAALAGAGEEFRQCLASSALKPNERQARSECMWKHWDYMASYGP